MTLAQFSRDDMLIYQGREESIRSPVILLSSNAATSVPDYGSFHKNIHNLLIFLDGWYFFDILIKDRIWKR